MARKVKLIDNWKKAHTFASIWWSVIGLICMVVDFIYNTWISLPDHVHDKIPNASVISSILFVCIMAARVIEFVKPENTDGNDQD